jgi:DNA-binding CsgD family transcriptional regulator
VGAQARHGQDAARRAFDAVAAARRVSSLPELDAVVGEALGRFGLTTVLMVTATPAPTGLDLAVVFGKRNAAWEDHYLGHDFGRHDALLQEIVRTGEPTFWSDLPARRSLGPMERRVFDHAGEFRLRNGFAVPIFHPAGALSTVACMGEHVDAADPDVRTAVHLLAIHYAGVGRRLLQAPSRPQPRLSRRQLECLKWARQGKSSTDIGDILGLSAHTVNEHLAAACARLGVRTRAQAVAEAALHGILEL